MKKSRMALMLSALLMLMANVGCNTKSEVEDLTSGACLVKAMTLGTLNRHLHTRSRSGADSIYTIKVTGSLYPLTIDQVNQRIFNVDSLPVGTDPTKILISELKATGTVSIQSKITGKDTVVNKKDSIDFSTPRIITVYATDRVSNRKYQVDIRVHKEWGDSVTWQRTASGISAFSSVRQLHAIAVESTLYAFGLEGTMPVVLTANTASPQQWTRHAITPATLDAHSVVRHGNRFFALASNQLMTSTDGINWTSANATGVPNSFTQLVGSGTKHLLALSGASLVSSTDGGKTWTADALDSSAPLPLDENAGIVFASTVSKNYEKAVVLGLRGNEPVLWQRDLDLSGTDTFGWVNFPLDAHRRGHLPTFQNYTLAHYDDALLLTGEKSDGSFGGLYLSRDNGYTWLQKELKVPAISGATSATVTVDAQNYIYIICAGSGEVWRGRINRLGWKNEDTLFK